MKVKSASTRKTSIKSMIYMQLETINNPKTTTFKKAISMRDFCKLGAWFMRDEIEKEFIKKFWNNIYKFAYDHRIKALVNEKKKNLPWDLLMDFMWYMHPEEIHRHARYFTIENEMGSDNKIDYTLDVPDEVDGKLERYAWDPVHFSGLSIDYMNPIFDWIFSTLLEKKVIDLEKEVEIPTDITLPELGPKQPDKTDEDED